MAVINWYPGHMTKSIRMIEDNIKLIDVLIYVLDARAPKSCINPDFVKYVSRLPVVYVLNKSDLADDVQTAAWKKKLGGERSVALSSVGTVSGSSAQVLAEIKRLCGAKIEKYAAKGVKTTIKAITRPAGITTQTGTVTACSPPHKSSDVLRVYSTPSCGLKGLR